MFVSHFQFQLDTEWYSQACMFDYCSLSGFETTDEQAVVCHYLSAYAMEAVKYGVRLVDWRRKDLCCQFCIILFFIL